jgi:hypothetical protein
MTAESKTAYQNIRIARLLTEAHALLEKACLKIDLAREVVRDEPGTQALEEKLYAMKEPTMQAAQKIRLFIGKDY